MQLSEFEDLSFRSYRGRKSMTLIRGESNPAYSNDTSRHWLTFSCDYFWRWRRWRRRFLLLPAVLVLWLTDSFATSARQVVQLLGYFQKYPFAVKVFAAAWLSTWYQASRIRFYVLTKKGLSGGVIKSVNLRPLKKACVSVKRVPDNEAGPTDANYALINFYNFTISQTPWFKL